MTRNLIALAASVLLGAQAVGQNEPPTPDLVDRMNAVLRSVQPEGENAWPLYERILTEGIGQSWEATKTEPGAWREFTASRWDLAVRGAWEDPRLDSHRTALERWAHLLPMLDDAAAAPGFARRYQGAESGSGPEGGGVVDIDSPMRELARFNTGAMRAAAKRGDWEACTERLRAGLSMARQQSLQPTSFAQLVAGSILAMHLTELRTLLNEMQLGAPDASAMLGVIDERHWGAGVGIVPFIEARLSVLGFASEDTALTVGMEPWTEAETMAVIEQLQSHLERMLVMSPRALRLYIRVDDLEEPDALFDPTTSAEALMQALYPAVRSPHMLTSDLAATRLMLLLEAHHARLGAWPDSLDEIGEPFDRIDPALGSPFGYLRTPDAPHGFPYELRRPADAPDDWLRDADGWLNPPRKALPEE